MYIANLHVRAGVIVNIRYTYQNLWYHKYRPNSPNDNYKQVSLKQVMDNLIYSSYEKILFYIHSHLINNLPEIGT